MNCKFYIENQLSKPHAQPLSRSEVGAVSPLFSITFAAQVTCVLLPFRGGWEGW
jgi:hypothetical protein